MKPPINTNNGAGSDCQERLVRPLTADKKLKLIEEPARRAISQLRILADDTTLGICDEGQCSLSNLALWLEGVLDEKSGYMPWCSETARVKLGWPNADVKASVPKRSPRYSFRMPDGRLPMVGGKLSWVGNRERADIKAKSWGAVAIVVLHRNAAGSWNITEEIPLPNRFYS